MNVIICCVISLCCMAAHYFFPLYGYTGGNYILAKPLVGGLICGVLLGDVKTGLEIGCAIQLTYLSYMTIGGAATIIAATIPESSSLSVNISSVTEIVSFSLRIGITPFSSITVMQCC